MALLAGRAALVTGAARGNGAAIARALAGEGASVALFDVDGPEAAAEAQRIAAATGAGTLGGKADVTGAAAFGGRADVTQAAEVEAAVAQTAEMFGPIDILVNNAGVLFDTPLPGLDLRLWEKTLAVNLTGPLRFINEVAPEMIAQGGGSIVNITSIAPHRIRVNAVAPGIIHTDMTKGLYADPVASAEIVSRIPLGYIAEPVEVAKAVVYLASDLSTYVTGTEHIVDAGYSIR